MHSSEGSKMRIAKLKTQIIAAALVSFMSAGAASAASFDFSFDIAGADYTGNGTFNGELQGDSDTILNMTNMMLSYTTGGTTYANTGNPIDGGGEWSLSGVTADWGTNAPGPGGMYIGGGEVGFGDPGNFLTAYDLNDFIITAAGVTAPVPVPATLPLMLGGIAGLGLLARRKRG
jgi:hypothetical protein